MMNASANPPTPGQAMYPLPMSGGGSETYASYQDLSGQSTTIAYTTSSGQPTNVTVRTADYNFDSANTSSIPSNQTAIEYSTLELDTTAQFQMNRATEVTLTSPCDFVAGSTYYVTVYAVSGTVQNNAAVDSFDASTNTITFPLYVPGPAAPYTFPQNTVVDIVISKSTP